jgi:hypothetical protein
MGSRTVRLRKQDLPEKILLLEQNSEIQVVLNNGKTLFGKFVLADEHQLILTEGNAVWYNTQVLKQTLEWQDILEIEFNLSTQY